MIPRFVALEYGGRTFKPLVIESIAQPLVLPRSKDGEMLSVSVQLTLATLTAWGKDDYFGSVVKPAKFWVMQTLILTILLDVTLKNSPLKHGIISHIILTMRLLCC